jgi:hypothetical protein
MAILNLELRGVEDGTAWLNYWDGRGGNDRVFLLKLDGTVQELSFGPGEDETEIYTPVDLVAELLKLSKD